MKRKLEVSMNSAPGKKKRKLEVSMNSALKLRRREAEGDRPTSRRAFAPEHFRRLHIQETFDPIQRGVQNLSLRVHDATEIVMIRKVDSLIFVIAASGLCVVYDRVSRARLGVLNQEADDIISDLHFNSLDDSVLSVSRRNSSVTGRCQSIPVKLLKIGKFEQRKNVFGRLYVPIYVKCLNEVAVVRNVKRTFDIFDLHCYSLLFSVTDDYVEDVHAVPQMLLIWRQVVRDVTTLVVRSIHDGMDIKEFTLPCDEVPQFCIVKDQLLYGDQHGKPNLLDMKSSKVKSLESDKLNKAMFRCLEGSDLLFSWENSTYSVWGLDPKKEKDKLELLCQGSFSGCACANVLVIYNDSLVVSYYRPEDASKTGSISVSNILTGQLIAKIPNDISGPEPNGFLQILDSVSSMYYDEEKEELYTGTIGGGFQIWSS